MPIGRKRGRISEDRHTDEEATVWLEKQTGTKPQTEIYIIEFGVLGCFFSLFFTNLGYSSLCETATAFSFLPKGTGKTEELKEVLEGHLHRH